MKKLIPRIIGSGWAAPETIRYNNDPIFDWLKQEYPHQNMFDGYDKRHILKPGETLIDIMLPAAQMALKNAGKEPKDIDILLGLGSISEYIQPNVLSQLHFKLGLPQSAWVIPIGNDYSNFSACLLFADGLIRAEHAKNVLICIGDNWSTNVNYHTLQSISAADGAGAAVVSLSEDTSKWYIHDRLTVTVSANYGNMHTSGLPLIANPPIGVYTNVFSPPFFQITSEGMEEFKSFGEITALTSVTGLLSKNNLTGDDITFMPHQTSQQLIDYWCANLTPPAAQVLNTIKEFANTTVATHALNFAWIEEKQEFEKDNLVMMALGPDMHSNASLLRRG